MDDDGLSGFENQRTKRRRRRTRRTATLALNQPLDLEKDVAAELGCTPEQDCLARAIAHYTALALSKSASTPVRPPSHNCPTVHSIDLEEGIKPTTDYTVLTAGATVSLISRRLNPAWYGLISGIAWTVAWDGATPGNPYLSVPVTLRVSNHPHPTYAGVTRQLTPSLAQLLDVNIKVPPTGQDQNQGTLLELVFTNQHATDAVRIDARLKGWQFPVPGGIEGIEGGLVPG